jgi:hypothetical protein
LRDAATAAWRCADGTTGTDLRQILEAAFISPIELRLEQERRAGQRQDEDEWHDAQPDIKMPCQTVR